MNREYDINKLAQEPPSVVDELYRRANSGEIEIEGDARVKLNEAYGRLMAMRGMERISEEETKPIAHRGPAKKIEWHDFLERLSKYRDIVMILGGMFIVVGSAVLSTPVALLVAGAAFLQLARMMAK